jgi:hypothetical protein
MKGKKDDDKKPPKDDPKAQAVESDPDKDRPADYLFVWGEGR